jgi:hypothetical protein
MKAKEKTPIVVPCTRSVKRRLDSRSGKRRHPKYVKPVRLPILTRFNILYQAIKILIGGKIK